MKIVTVHQAKTQLSKYLAEVEEAGEEIIIARRDKPVARLVPIKDEKIDRSGFIASGVGVLSEEAVEYLTSAERDAEIEADFYSSASEDRQVESKSQSE